MLRVLVLVTLLTGTARGEPWYRGRHGTNRILHLSLTTIGLVSYPLVTPVEEDLAADACRWCHPTGLDRITRDALRWTDTTAPGGASDIVAYGLTPFVSLGLLSLGTLADPSWAAAIDDFIPVLEAMMITQWVTRAIKLPVGRQRPYAHYTGPADYEDNLSFPSGHTSRAFSLVVSAAMVARARGYRSEPTIWIAGLTLASATAYLRIAADKHYLTDVLAGAAIGSAAGLTVPLLMCRNAVVVVPASDGVALAGSW